METQCHDWAKNCHDWSQTYTGRKFFPLNPSPDDISIEDIAHSLSLICRFGGHTKAFYSVAQHSILVSMNHPEDRLKGLLHDATEAYCGDVIRPLKKNLSGYDDIEFKIWKAVCAKFGMTTDFPESLRQADNLLLVTERRDLLNPCAEKWHPSLEAIAPLEKRIQPLAPDEAEFYFLSTFRILMIQPK